MKSTCIKHPPKERLIVLHVWQIAFCDGNKAAAALLSIFEYWHNIKLDMFVKNRQQNVIAERHGEEGTQDVSLYQFHSLEELSDQMLGLYGRTAIVSALKLLVQKEVVTVHRNPNPRYGFDRTNYYLFHPEIINQWLDTRYLVDFSDSSDLNDASYRSEPPSSESERPSFKSERTITEMTAKMSSENTNNTHTAASDGRDSENNPLHRILTLLQQEGVPAQWLAQEADKAVIQSLLEQGATAADFREAAQKARATTHGQNFGVRYLKPIIEDLLARSPVHSDIQQDHYTTDLSHASWVNQEGVDD